MLEMIAHQREKTCKALGHSRHIFHEALAGGGTVYLSAFRTVEPFQGRGYFSKLFHFMIGDLRQKGFTKATLGVETGDTKSKKIYARYGFCEYVSFGKEYYPDGTVIDVEYYRKDLA